MLISCFVFAVSLSQVSAVIKCPTGYDTFGYDDKCFKLYTIQSHHVDAASQCIDDGARLIHINNAFENTQLMTNVVKQATTNLWLGLKCAANSPSNCIWDNDGTDATAYNNFVNGYLNTDLGNCVMYLMSGNSAGKWMSTECDMSTLQYVCEYDGTVAQDCGDYQTYNNKCYKAYTSLTQLNENDAEARCVQECGHLASVHDATENAFILNMFKGNTNGLTFTRLGLKFNGNTYYWLDGTTYDYRNFGYDNTNLGYCIGMELNDDLILASQWGNINCDKTMPFVCKREKGSCATSAPPTAAPPTCTSPVFLDGIGDFYSPNYPNEYSTAQQTCQYILTVPTGVVALNFNVFNVDAHSSVALYNDITDSTPAYNLNGQIPSNRYYYSTTNQMKVVFKTNRAQIDDSNYRWAAHFQSSTNNVTNPTNPPNPSSSGCNSGAIYAPGAITSPNYPNDYPSNTDCRYDLATTAGKRIFLEFIDVVTESCCDIIQVFDGPSQSSPLLGRFGGTYAAGVKNFTSSGPEMLVLFTTDYFTSYRGFSASFVGF